MRIRRHKKFLKDFRDTKLSDSQFEKFVSYINAFRENNPLPPQSKDHILSGNYTDCREFHLGGDMLIIYIESSIDEVVLMRIGTH
ncbi:MAG: type II toxin-antitoxin system YafQ family toxin [Sulfurovum sp.]|nr:type II toxin-antitoxin system YafQ family toxin [Sulfurovum sp.]